MHHAFKVYTALKAGKKEGGKDDLGEKRKKLAGKVGKGSGEPPKTKDFKYSRTASKSMDDMMAEEEEKLSS